MKALILTAGLALGMGMMSLAPASAAALVMTPTVAAPSMVSDVACRMVERRVSRPGPDRVTRTRVCDDRGRYGYRSDRRVYGERRVYRERNVYRPAPRPGLSIRVNP